MKSRFSINWKTRGKQESEMILQEIAPHVSDNGYSDLVFEVAVDRLAMRLDWDKAIPESYKSSIMREAIFASQKSGSMTPDTLYSEIRRVAEKLVEPKPERLIASTWITVQSDLPLPKPRQIGGIRISAARVLPSKFQIEDRWKSVDDYSCFVSPPNCLVLRASITAFSKFTASPEVYEVIDYLRGLWNLSVNRFYERQSSGGMPSAFNRIRNPYALLIHHPDGSLAFDEFWFAGNRPYREKLFVNRKAWVSAFHFEASTRKRLRSFSIGPEIRQLIRLYAFAMDVKDLDISISRLWMILEKIALTSSKGEHYKIPGRISSLFVDADRAALELDDFRKIRNGYVHDLLSWESRELLVGRLNFYVAQVLHYLIAYCDRFDCLSDFAEFLELQSQSYRLSEKVTAWKVDSLPKINSLDAIRNSEPILVAR